MLFADFTGGTSEQPRNNKMKKFFFDKKETKQ